MHFRAAEILFRRHLAGCRLEERRPREEGLAAPPDRNDIIAKARHIGAARGRGAMQHGDDGDARRAQPREIGEDAAARDEAFDRVFHQVGARALDQMNEGKLFLKRDFLAAAQAIATTRRHGTGIDAAVVDDDGDAYARDEADACDHAATGYGFFRIVGVEQIARHVADLEERHAGIEKPRQPLARRQLAAFIEARFTLFGREDATFVQFIELRRQVQHLGAIRLECVRHGADFRYEAWHGNTLSGIGR